MCEINTTDKKCPKFVGGEDHFDLSGTPMQEQSLQVKRR